MRCKSPTDASLGILATALSLMISDKANDVVFAYGLFQSDSVVATAPSYFLLILVGKYACSKQSYTPSLFINFLDLTYLTDHWFVWASVGGIGKAYPARLAVLASRRVSC